MSQLCGMVEDLMRQANEAAENRGHAVVGTEHVLLAMTLQSDGSFARRLLDEIGVTEEVRARIENLFEEA